MADKSSIFDTIRIKSRRGGKKVKPEVPQCGWEDCDKPGIHKAPKSHQSNSEFYNFCLEHVRKYNQSFNYFAKENEEKDQLEAALHRAALSGEQLHFGKNPIPKKPRKVKSSTAADPLHLYARLAARSKSDNPDKKPVKRLMPSDRDALGALGLKGHQSTNEIKTAYKALVKIHHPDANGGDKSSEERLRIIITAYTHLKQRGFL